MRRKADPKNPDPPEIPAGFPDSGQTIRGRMACGQARTEVPMQHSRTRLLIDGAVAGLIGGAVIAVWFFIFDAAGGEPLKTPEILSAALLHYSNSQTAGATAWPLVGGYLLAHFIAFAIIGAAAAM